MSPETKSLLRLFASVTLTLLTLIFRLREPTVTPISPGVDLID